MKKLITLLIVLPILGFIIAIVCGVPVLDWVAWLFDFLKTIFSTLADWCRWLQKLVNWGVIKK